MSKPITQRAFLCLAAVLCLLAGTVQASESNKWRLQFSGGADSDGTIVIQIAPHGGEPFTATVNISDNTSENRVAKQTVKDLKAQLPKDSYRVERDDGEDVLIKKRSGAGDFEVSIVSNDVKGVRINIDKE
jgi:hypothetical protein